MLLVYVLGVGSAIMTTWYIIQVLGKNPVLAFTFFLVQSLGSMEAIAETLVIATPILFGAISLIPFFTAKYFNIGTEGQLQLGAIFATGIGMVLGTIHPALGWPIVILVAFAGGALWSFIPAVLKVRLGVNEVITTLMSNFIALLLVSYLIAGPWLEPGSFQLWSPAMPSQLLLPKILPPTRLHAGFLLSIVFVPVMWLIMSRSVLGYRVRAMGASMAAAKYGGINTGRTVLLVSILGGGLAGLAGMSEIYGISFHLVDGFSLGYGFTAIAVVFLGRYHPLGVLAVSFFFGMLINGGFAMQRGAGIPLAVTSYFQGVILVAVILYEGILRKRLLKHG
jgi:simple sugar transport system permease protein